jgi:acetate---CoA ligase (ADP-forming)
MGIEQLLRPRSVAIVGASDNVGPGFNAWNALQYVDFKGEIYLVNPNKPQLFGKRCYKSLADIPGPIDGVFVSVQADRVLGIAREAAAKGVGGLAILSSGFGEAGEAGMLAQTELVELAEHEGIAVCGPNCLGFLNFAHGAALFGTSLPETVQRGKVAAVVQSGSVGIALLNAARGLGLSYLITSGNEAVTTTADYLEALIDDAEVRIVIVFSEQIKRPKKFLAMLDRARDLGKPVIVLKCGRSALSRAAVMAHTGAVAGSAEAWEAALHAAGAMQVDSLDELVETAVLAAGIRSVSGRRGLGVLSLSGGEIALVLDVVERTGIELPLSEAASRALADLLPRFANISNPLDLTWAGLYDPEIARKCACALAEQSEVGMLVLVQDAPAGLGDQQAGRYSRLLASVARGAREVGKPLVAISNLSGEIHPELRKAAAAAQVPYLRGTPEGFSAVAKHLRRAEPVRVHGPISRSYDMDAARARMRGAGGMTRVLNERDARGVLAAYGVAGPRERLVATEQQASSAAGEIGFPVALKCLVPGIVHKSDAGFVEIGLRSANEVATSAARMLAAARSMSSENVQLLIQRQVAPVVELLVGGRIDREVGPLIVVGGGGVLVELYRDIVVRTAPISEEGAMNAIRSTRAGRLIDGFRSRPRGDMTAVARVVSAVSCFVADFADEIVEVEINPLAVLPEGEGCIALDCVILPVTRAASA